MILSVLNQARARGTLLLHLEYSWAQPVHPSPKVPNQVFQATRIQNFQDYGQHSHCPLVMPTGLVTQQC